MSTALKASIMFITNAAYPAQVRIDEGSLYLAMIETDRAVLLADFAEGKISPDGNDKTVIVGEFWEEHVSYAYDDEDDEDDIQIRGSGDIAFELVHDGQLNLSLEDADIRAVHIAWAEDGDSEKYFPTTSETMLGSISKCEKDENFEGF